MRASLSLLRSPILLPSQTSGSYFRSTTRSFIKITDNAIIPMKERVVDRKYDPLVWLGNKIGLRNKDTEGRTEV